LKRVDAEWNERGKVKDGRTDEMENGNGGMSQNDPGARLCVSIRFV